MVKTLGEGNNPNENNLQEFFSVVNHKQMAFHAL